MSDPGSSFRSGRSGARRDLLPAPPAQEVATGEVGAAISGRLQASALGSCVAVALYDQAAGVGGLAHVMLPGAAPTARAAQRTRYAEDAIPALVQAMAALGARPGRLAATMAGGGNVLQRPGETLCRDNLRSISRTLERLGIPLLSSNTGGIQRRSLELEVATGRVRITVGDSPQFLLWEPQGSPP